MPRVWLVAISGLAIVLVLVLLSLVATPAPAGPQRAQNAPLSPVLDDFNRPDEDPLSWGGRWEPTDAGPWAPLELKDNVATHESDSSTSDSYWIAQTFGGSVEAWARGLGGGAGGIAWGIGLLTQVGGTGQADGWRFRIEKSNAPGATFTLRRFDNGQTPMTPADSQSGAPSSYPGYLLIRRVGSSIEGWHSSNGTNWTLVVNVTDASFATTDVHLSLGIADNSSSQILSWDDFGGGGLATPLPGQSIGVCDGVGTHAQTSSSCQHDPVDSLTGAFITSAIDLRLPGIGVPFSWRRSYTSSDATVGRLGPGWTDSYATSLIVQGNGDVLLHGDEGQQVYYTRQGDGSFVGPPGARSLLSSVGGGYELLRRDQVLYRFDSSGHLLSMRDRNNQGLTLVYAGSELQTITDSVGRQIAVMYESGLLDRVTLPDGRYVEYGYLNGRLQTVRDARGFTTTYTYDAGGRLKTIVDQNQHTVVDNTYGPDGRVTQQVNARGKVGTFSWDAQTRTQTYRDARGKEWKDVYAGSFLFERRDPLGNTTRFLWDGDLNIRTVTNPRGFATTMTYDPRGNMLTRTAPAPLSYDEVWTYTARNDPLTYRDRRGSTTDFGYDGAGNLTSLTRPDADGPGPLGRPQTLFGRDPAGTGLLSSLTDPRGKTTTFSYLNGNLSEIRSARGHRTTLCYDGSGRLIGLVDPRSTPTCTGAIPLPPRWKYAYNANDQLVTQEDPLGHVTTLAYDPAGNLESRTDANGHVTGYGYLADNLLQSVTASDPDGGGPDPAPVTEYAYDDAGNLQTRTDANSHVTSYAYDDANRLERVTAPDNRMWTYAYDANGNVKDVIDANGNFTTGDPGDGKTSYGYDALDRLTSVTYADSTPDVTSAYDGNDNRTQMTDGSGTETSVYDPLDRLTSVTRGSTTLSFGYDLLNLTSRTYPGMPVTTYGYDDDEHLSSVSWGANTLTYEHDPAGNLGTTDFPDDNGWTENRYYDDAGRLTGITTGPEGAFVPNDLSTFTMSLDPVGNPLEIVRTGTLEQTQTYSYDDMDRLKGVCFQAGACPGSSDPFIRWSYDGVGNRLSESRPSGTTAYSYNAADELLQAGGTSYTYDENGNQLSAGARTFAYDLANRLKTTTLASTTTTYAYDADGKRLQASTGAGVSQKTNFLWDPSFALPQLAHESDGAGAALRRYRYGLSRISMSSGSTVSYFHPDALGSTADLTAGVGGASRWTWSYEPFGAIRSEQEWGSGQPANPMRFTGEYLDPTGLYHLRARQYDPGSGRSLSRDPLEPAMSETGVSPYAYVGNRPSVLVDPSGLRWCDPVCGVVDPSVLGFERAVGAVGRFTQQTDADLALGLTAALCGGLTVATGGAGGVCLPFVVGALATGVSRSAVESGVAGNKPANYCTFASSVVTSASLVGTTRLLNLKLWQGGVAADKPFVVDPLDRGVFVGVTHFFSSAGDYLAGHALPYACTNSAGLGVPLK